MALDEKRDRAQSHLITWISLFGGPALGGAGYAYSIGGWMLMAMMAGMAAFVAFIVVGLTASVLNVDFQRGTSRALALVSLFAFFGGAAAFLTNMEHVQLYDTLWFEQWAPWVGGGIFLGGVVFMASDRPRAKEA